MRSALLDDACTSHVRQLRHEQGHNHRPSQQSVAGIRALRLREELGSGITQAVPWDNALGRVHNPVGQTKFHKHYVIM